MADVRKKPVYRLEVGDEAPDFKLLGTKDGAGRGKGFEDFTLASWRGKSLVLAFYPAAYTPV